MMIFSLLAKHVKMFTWLSSIGGWLQMSSSMVCLWHGQFAWKRICIIFLAPLLAQPIAQAQDTTLFWEFSSGNWSGGAYKNTQGGFSHCAVSASYKNGISLATGLTRNYDLNLVLWKDDWRLPDSKTHKVGLMVDGKYLGKFDAVNTQTNLLSIGFGNRADIFKKLRHGYVLKVIAKSDEFHFSLKGTNTALGKVRECVDVATMLTPSNSSLFSTANTNPFSYGQKSKRVDDKAVVRALLVASGLYSVSLIDPSSAKMPEATYAWIDDDIGGGLWIFDSVGTTPEQTSKAVFRRIASACDGSFSSKSGATSRAGTIRVRQYYTECNEIDGELYWAIIALETETEVVFFVNYTKKQSEHLQTVNENIAAMLIILLTE